MNYTPLSFINFVLIFFYIKLANEDDPNNRTTSESSSESPLHRNTSESQRKKLHVGEQSNLTPRVIIDHEEILDLEQTVSKSCPFFDFIIKFVLAISLFSF